MTLSGPRNLMGIKEARKSWSVAKCSGVVVALETTGQPPKVISSIVGNDLFRSAIHR
jgi:hypothetical protein